MEKRENSTKNTVADCLTVCPFCGADSSAEQRKVRLRSKVKANGKLIRLLKKYNTDPKSLGKFQLNIVQNYINSINKLKVTCNICRKTSQMAGQKRSKVMTFKTEDTETLNISSAVSQHTEDIVSSSSSKKKKKNKKKSQDGNSTKNTTGVSSLNSEATKVEPVVKTLTTTPIIKPSLQAKGQTTKGQVTEVKLSKSAKKKKAQMMNQQLSFLMNKEKKKEQSASLSDFLSNL